MVEWVVRWGLHWPLISNLVYVTHGCHFHLTILVDGAQFTFFYMWMACDGKKFPHLCDLKVLHGHLDILEAFSLRSCWSLSMACPFYWHMDFHLTSNSVFHLHHFLHFIAGTNGGSAKFSIDISHISYAVMRTNYFTVTTVGLFWIK